MQLLPNGTLVDEQLYDELQEAHDIEEVEKEVSKLIYDASEREWNRIVNMSTREFINSINK